MITDSGVRLRDLGYSVSGRTTPPEEPERSNTRFRDVLPEITRVPSMEWLADQRLYNHQLAAMNALEEGLNVILRSGTGSGKTEAWVLYALSRIKQDRSFKALAVYPTLALSNDQILRIKGYASSIGASVVQMDAPSRDALLKAVGRTGLKTRVGGANILITNPAYLLSELKRFFVKPKSSYLEPFFRKPGLIVVDELDFYGPRELSLLMGMINLISGQASLKPQVVALTATLSNPVDLGEYLEEVTGRKYRIIEGRPFHVENRLYIVLGKQLRRVWEELRKLRSLITPGEIDGDVLRALEDYQYFEANPYRVVSYLEALGHSVPSIGLDYAEILSLYGSDDGVTLVFTRSISRAEEVYKRLAEKGLRDKAATHHHLVPKKTRETIEERARKGELKIIVTPRTLVQGIDIGNIVRIVHLGLPQDVREFIQREGRKGRRASIPFTESIVIPFGPWDRDLLSKGVEALEKWLSLDLEKTMVNPHNHYMNLLTGVVKVVSPWFKAQLSSEEKEALELAGIMRNGELDRRKTKWLWDRLGFYELGPPYGVKRYLVEDSFKKPLEPIGYCDLVEYFQIGTIDYSNDAIVTSHNLASKGRIVTGVVEEPVRQVRFWQNDAFASALEEYIDTKTRWREEANIVADILRGRVYSRVDVAVYPPRRGFGLLTKIPYKVNWILSSEKPRILRLGDRHVVTRNTKLIPLVTPVNGVYRDYTYGFLYEVDEKLDNSLLRLGLALIAIYLRRKHALPLDLIEYGIQVLGDKKYIELHESSAAGIIERIDWYEISRGLRDYQPDDLDLVLLNLLDQIAYSDFVSGEYGWDPVKQYALIILDYLMRDRTILVRIMDDAKAIPKPGSSNKIVALDAVFESLDKEGSEGPGIALLSLVAYDGEDFRSFTDIILAVPGLKPPINLKLVEDWVSDRVYYDEFRLVVPYKDLSKGLRLSGLRRLPSLIDEKGVEVIPALSKVYGAPAPISQLMEAVHSLIPELRNSPGLEEAHRIVSRIREKGYKRLLPGEKRIIEGYLRARTVAIYLGYLVTRMQG